MYELDHFLNAAYEKTAALDARQRMVDQLRQLPEEELRKLASGEEKLGYYHSDDGKWLDRFKGSPLFEKALAIEEADLQAQMARKAKSQQERDRWREEDNQRDEMSMQRKLLDLELAKSEAGGGGEGAAFAGQETPKEEIAEHVQMQQKGQVPTPPPAPAAPAPKTEVKVGMAKIATLAARMKVAAGLQPEDVYAAGAVDAQDDMLRNAIVDEAVKQQAVMDQAKAQEEAMAAAPPVDAAAEVPAQEESEPEPKGDDAGGAEESEDSAEKESSVKVAAAAALMREAMEKDAIGIGMTAKAIGGAAKRIWKGKGTVGGNLGTAGRAVKSFAKKNPGQAAAIGGAAALGTGMALGS